MRFEGQALLDVLRRQTEPVKLCDAAGAVFGYIESIGGLAARLQCDVRSLRVRIEAGIYGIGTRRRIRYLQAKSSHLWGGGWRGGSRTTRPLRADQTCSVHAPGQLMNAPVDAIRPDGLVEFEGRLQPDQY